MNKTIWKQYDSRWGSKNYPVAGSSFSGNGCGCCACTHVAMEQERYKNWTPEKLRPWMVKQGFAVYRQGTTWSGITKTLQHIGHKNVTYIGIYTPMSTAFKELNKGNRIGIILFEGGAGPNGTVWTAGGHYVAFTAYRIKDGVHQFYCKDSGGRGHDGWYSYERSMKGVVYQMWIVERINEPKEPPKKTTKKKAHYTGDYPVSTVNKEVGTMTDIKRWQKFLNWWGANLKVDGDFGKKTYKATVKFQKEYGLESDGSVGPKTIKKAKKVGAKEKH